MPLKQPDAKQYEAMARLISTDDGKEFCRWLIDARGELLEQLSARDDKPGVMRGETRTLKQIIDALTDSQQPPRYAREGSASTGFFR